ncbi:hypothetical protein VR44_38865 [Streptomyces katrae]|uniref:Uncharacterized protein n=1 Tax=Streptomyces katrae TaxID=68223 RepID=A0A0F4IDA8_9ACTN|nr:hypothetical protein VR44_38865 [Streptomyces katrae]
MDEVLVKALAKTPEDRWGSCLEFTGALRRAGTAPVPVPVAGAVAGAAADAGALAQAAGPPPPPPPPRWALPVFRGRA